MVSLKEYIVTRILLAIPTILILLTFIFFLTHIIPGDPTMIILGENAPPELIEETRRKLGFDQPLHVQYFRYISGVLKGDLGKSIHSVQMKTMDVAYMISERIGVTVQLSIIAWTLSLLVGVSTGLLSSINEDRIIDNFFRGLFLLLYSIPSFVIGILLQMVFGVYFRILPIFGSNSEAFRMDPITGISLLDYLLARNLAGFWDGIYHLILPSVTLATYYSGLMSRLSRSEMIRASSRMYCLVAEAKGLKKRTIAFKHAFRNAILPIFTLSGLQAISLLTGSIMVETIFSLNGLGRLFVYASMQRDYMLIQGCATIFALVAVAAGIIIDIGYYFLDPRIRY